jgi:zinc protease
MWYCELEQNRMVRKTPGGEAKQSQGPSDTTQALASTLTEYKADLFVTSGHATERGWQIGFRYRNGEFQSKAGELFGVDTMGTRIPISSANPKVYLPIGNCLMGHIDGPDAMALAFMNSAGVRQMMGYTVPTWYGYAGWGCLDYFVEQPGRYTFVEAFFANQHALIDRLEMNFPDIARLDTPPGSMPSGKLTLSDAARKAGLSDHDGRGLLHDRDVVALYGDPAWSAKLAPGKLSYEQTLTEVAAGVFALEIKPLSGEKSFEPVNQNGSQRGWRPFVHFFPNRLKDIEIISGKELSPVITDNFVLIPNPRICDPNKPCRVEFKATFVTPQSSTR